MQKWPYYPHQLYGEFYRTTGEKATLKNFDCIILFGAKCGREMGIDDIELMTDTVNSP